MTSTRKARGGEREAGRNDEVEAILGDLERNASKAFLRDMSSRYGIVTSMRVFGTPMANMKRIARTAGRDHELAAALWQTGVYEARIVASMVEDPKRITSAQMDRWIKACDNWALVDTLCFNLFDRTPYAFGKVEKWAKARDEFVKRAAFALLACCALHRRGEDADYRRLIPLIEKAASDDRNFVKKGVSWALRAIGDKGSEPLRAQARALSERLAESEDSTARWIGRDALKAFAKRSARIGAGTKADATSRGRA